MSENNLYVLVGSEDGGSPVDTDMLSRLRTRLTDNGVVPSDEILTDCIENAKHAILSRRFPYGNYPSDVENRYKELQYRLAIEIYNRLGAEGEISHSENGISRSWDGSWASSQLLNEIVPFAGVVS